VTRLEGEVEGFQRLDYRQSRGAHRCLQPAVVAQSDLRCKGSTDENMWKIVTELAQEERHFNEVQHH